MTCIVFGLSITHSPALWPIMDFLCINFHLLQSSLESMIDFGHHTSNSALVLIYCRAVSKELKVLITCQRWSIFTVFIFHVRRWTANSLNSWQLWIVLSVYFTILTILLIVILFAAKGITINAGSSVREKWLLLSVNTHFALGFKALPAVENPEIFWIILTRWICRWRVLVHGHNGCCGVSG